MADLALNVVSELLKYVGSQAKEEVGLLWNFKDDMKEMKETLVMLEAVLQDAESRSNKEKPVQLWLADLRDACYDIQHMLDDYMLQYRQQNDHDQLYCFGCVEPVKVCFENFYSHIVLAYKMKSMRARLSKIADLKNKFALKEKTVLDVQIIDKNRETFYAPESVVLGRGGELDQIVNKIINKQTSEHIYFIPIFGVAGLGKTTLAKLIINDRRVKKHFDVRIWANIGSIEFDLYNVGSRIISSFRNSEVNMHSLEIIGQEWKKEVKGKRFLIVLDDVWTVDKVLWDRMVDMLINSSKGSTIVVTTRIEKTATDIASDVPYPLNTLSDETCIILFQQRAFQSEDEMNKYPNLVNIGEAIAKKCGGIALAAITLGSMLHFKRDERIWLHVRDGENLLEFST